MGKISQVSSKYIINCTIDIEGIVERPDVIGAVFGQTEGLLGTDLELRELQRSGRIGRIEVELETKGGKTSGTIVIPSSLDKAETSIVAAALEIIERIGPCNAKVIVNGIEDVRINKRDYVLSRAKELLKDMVDGVIPDSHELRDTVSDSVKAKDLVLFGKDELAAGPEVEISDEIIVVEGRADVLSLLKCGYQNAIAMNGTSCPPTLRDLTKEKTVTMFVDGDRGGDLIIRELLTVGKVDFITKAPDGKEVEELTSKEIHKALRSKVPADKVKKDFLGSKTTLRRKSLVTKDERPRDRRDSRRDDRRPRNDRRDNRNRPPRDRRDFKPRQPRISAERKEKLKGLLDSLVGSRGALILDKELNVMGKVPVKELATTMESLRGSDADTIVFDGKVEQDMIEVAENSRLKTLVAMESGADARGTRVRVYTGEQLA